MRFLFLLLLSLPAQAANLVVIGDSHSCGSFGSSLVARLAKQGNSVTLYCSISSAPRNWLQGKNAAGQSCQTYSTANSRYLPCGGTGAMPSAAAISARHANASVVIALGTNSLLNASADASYRQLASVFQKNGQPCLWIGPPHLQPENSKGFPAGRLQLMENNLNSFYTSLWNAVNFCTRVDSRAATIRGSAGFETADGVHRTARGGRAWAGAIPLP